LSWPLASSARRRACIEHVVAKHGVSERMACRVLGQYRSTQRKIPLRRLHPAWCPWPCPIRQRPRVHRQGRPGLDHGKNLREAGLIILEKGVLRVPNWDALKEAGELDPTYLHLKNEQGAA
jgi:hypothetical protein